ncbi:Xanthine phosphoribosyltransferase [Commensalibacter sp. Nvir]|uniref:xanthine phosphoribosyltransferase n=1 Tax=Commensalibacter sp. Nvir TaxID=3069817 RepID=UPI002D3685A4|nr:Xanthine phosphoribosyltransferase [Commensalibacter sp. Nvir]
MKQYKILSWKELHYDSYLLARSLSAKSFKGIIAVTRGGLAPAAIISYELGCRFIETFSIVSYDNEKQGVLSVLKEPNIDHKGNGYLVIDDLVDSGNTAITIKKILPEAYFACLYAKPEGKPYVHEFIKEVEQNTWVLFPWDVKPHIP